MEKTNEKRVYPQKKIWTNEETKGFLAAYAARKEEFEHTRRKKIAMQNVLEDMIAQNILTEPIDVSCLTNKLKNLLRTYKAAKVENNRTGSSPILAPFHNEMEELFGSEQNILNSNVLNLRGKPITPLQVVCSASAPPSLQIDLSSTIPPLSIPISQSPISSAPTSPSTSVSPIPRKKMKKDSSYFNQKIKYLKQKQQLKREMFDEMQRKKNERFNIWMTEQRRKHDEKMQLLKKCLDKHTH